MPKQMTRGRHEGGRLPKVIAEVGAASMKDMGKVMAALKERYAGQMDFAKASGAVKELLSAAEAHGTVNEYTAPPSSPGICSHLAAMHLDNGAA